MTPLTPSPEQSRILDLGLTSIRIRAGAGTGKTTTIAMVIANLMENYGVAPEQILGVTFTNKAAAELSDRVRETLGTVVEAGRQIEIHTYHGFAAQILAEFGALAGVDNRAKVITPTFARQLMSETFHHTAYEHIDITQARSLDKIRRLGDRLGDHLLQPDDLLEAGSGETDDVWLQRLEMARTLQQYNADKVRLRVVDYADLVTLSTGLVKDHPRLAEEIRDRYRVVVLDEYQDTNPAQQVLLSSVFGDGFPVIAVGDEDQTIYEWRGASAQSFAAFAGQFPTRDGAPAHEVGLTLNRRSAQEILDVANDVRSVATPGVEPLQTSDPSLEGEVTTHWAGDALEEADWIARRFEALHDSGERWRDMAILFRKNKDFSAMIDSLTRHDIPMEVANVGGLLSVPEVAEMRAWLTVLDHPEDSAALTQILFGSRFGLGLADLAPLTRWVTGVTPDTDDAEEPSPVTLIEAVEQSESIPGLRSGAKSALRRFHTVYRDVLTESQGLTLIETCRLILDRTRAWQDIDALPPNPRLTARLNIYRLLDLAEDWSPLRGRPSVAAFLDYLTIMEQEPADELDSARLSGEDAVTLVTVHRAKGLEWDTVAIPAVYNDNFPARSQQYPDPFRFGEYLPPRLRIDSALGDLPDDDEARKPYLRERHLDQEWRVAYVAVTRPRRRLLVSGAYWYGLPEPSRLPKKPSPLFQLVEDHPSSTDAGHVRVGDRPPILRSTDSIAPPDPLFPDGWAEALRAAGRDPSTVAAMASELGVSDEYEKRLEATEQRLFALAEPTTGPGTGERMLDLSVTGLVTYAQCPKRFYWSAVDPLPRRRNDAAVRGTRIHRRIELHQRGQVPFDEIADDLYDHAPDEFAPSAGGYRAYEGSRFADQRAEMVEAPFSLGLSSGHTVRGRIDAIYCDGPNWEVVDFKSGRPSQDRSRVVQLQAYAVAARQVGFGRPPPSGLDVTFAYLGGGLTTQTFHADEQWTRYARRTIETLAADIGEEMFNETPGAWCANCDFLRFCGPGKAEVGS